MAQQEEIILETKRLFIKPLSYEQLCLYPLLDHSLEHNLGVEPHPRTLSKDLKEAFEQFFLPSVANPANNYLYSTLWTIIHKEKNRMVGDLCFKGEPNAQGEIEVGYGTYSDFQNQGFMTEALGELVKWALNQPKVTVILAETDQSNPASHKTLSKNGFIDYQHGEAMIWWKLEKEAKEV